MVMDPWDYGPYGDPMHQDPSSKKSAPSTTWEWRKIKMRPAGTAPERKSARGRPSALSRWNRRERLTITVHSRGGPEAWWELRARGRVWRRPGHHCLEDVLGDIFDGEGGQPSTGKRDRSA